MEGTLTSEPPKAAPKDKLKEHLALLKGFNNTTPFTLDAKIDLDDWFNTAVNADSRVDKRKLSDFRFLKRELAKLFHACAILAKELPGDYGATTPQKLWETNLHPKHPKWDMMPHSLSESEIGCPVSVLQYFFQNKALDEWLNILEEFDDAAISFNNDFFECFEHSGEIYLIRDQLHKLLDAAFLIALA
ncbi:MAG: hypothetical protein BGO55_08555 [Sphingobacteriales bacterium 50-39]|nr:hypothetical protein [Sphingobacteriales bacterium]OJW59314.1 MAG: hypothetical protein BGO55_08555 [Sphingobacteriales bacterium 50-39]